MSSQRIERVNTLMQQSLGEIVLREVELPQESFVTISKVQTSKDLQQARVLLMIQPEMQEAFIMQLLNKHRPYLQHLLHQQIKLRYSPKIFFVVDEQAKKVARIESILNRLG
ncbi:MAG: ribosome-binding factor A [Candidatus Kerfeldbacteria bacterium RIFCSPHIGHO2_02_FULL_42_14]|uniref:Ribosome-binding factor A n=1 Tax=Candidatus Kerfeldbacteria bacterium RIFCSPHIGHO2_02_FULL_42_14 TaxID=1798540 RepID=A0A1G2AU99_9BACT|nr:MAG: ribosome-binding factor A [Candidatus Kerfeldbacteria bacterium RIFCSPHIGHO2_02_FULL_42_14]OGY81575.1 MAG: ribosome-binding factor A [Candidatus Kerfeldbacteria bacterium RIFCSPHIGHO2_12_FULL_42_13]OGY83176.1 MAG: ribosome-binding factor A [Candidatus Kerfeldbacteria bacterium RIFCSPLOWO2_02_FULL_42_19]OGY86271.1 MAG: ribosome-binding factor A [Candidatus Kerfeldbacteria bacterium RIFCSPLOWO2_12_FULL_43_9]